jgi:hypothetical protein
MFQSRQTEHFMRPSGFFPEATYRGHRRGKFGQRWPARAKGVLIIEKLVLIKMAPCSSMVATATFVVV